MYRPASSSCSCSSYFTTLPAFSTNTTYSGQQEQPVHVDGVNRYLSDQHIVYHVIIINNVFPSTAINLRRCMKYLLSVPIALPHSPPPLQYNIPSYYVIYQFSKRLTTPTPRGQFPHRTTCTCHAMSRPPPAAPDYTSPPCHCPGLGWSPSHT